MTTQFYLGLANGAVVANITAAGVSLEAFTPRAPAVRTTDIFGIGDGFTPVNAAYSYVDEVASITIRQYGGTVISGFRDLIRTWNTALDRARASWSDPSVQRIFLYWLPTGYPGPVLRSRILHGRAFLDDRFRSSWVRGSFAAMIVEFRREFFWEDATHSGLSFPLDVTMSNCNDGIGGKISRLELGNTSSAAAGDLPAPVSLTGRLMTAVGSVNRPVNLYMYMTPFGNGLRHTFEAEVAGGNGDGAIAGTDITSGGQYRSNNGLRRSASFGTAWTTIFRVNLSSAQFTSFIDGRMFDVCGAFQVVNGSARLRARLIYGVSVLWTSEVVAMESNGDQWVQFGSTRIPPAGFMPTALGDMQLEILGRMTVGTGQLDLDWVQIVPATFSKRVSIGQPLPQFWHFTIDDIDGNAYVSDNLGVIQPTGVQTHGTPLMIRPGAGINYLYMTWEGEASPRRTVGDQQFSMSGHFRPRRLSL